MAHANPGLRPGLSSAVPPGLDFVMVVLTQTLKPNLFSILSGPTKSRALIQNRVFPQPVWPLRYAFLEIYSERSSLSRQHVQLLRDWKYLATVLLSMESLMLRMHERLWLKGVCSPDAQTS
jgi:hypothetical protein